MQEATPLEVTIPARARNRSGGVAGAVVRRALADSLAGSSDTQRVVTSGQVFDAFVVGDTTVAPFKAVGRLFGVRANGAPYSCSGTLVRSQNRSTAITAGHCVKPGRRFASRITFVPGYDRGGAPFGRWPAKFIGTTRQFASNQDLRYDIGALVLFRNGAGRPVNEVSRPVDPAFNRKRSQLFRALGYPADEPFNGRRQRDCDSRFLGADRGLPQPRPNRIACNMTAGASGGGWLIRSTERLNSLTSYSITSEPERLFGPYFGKVARRLYDQASSTPTSR
jgi:hypothetical protein